MEVEELIELIRCSFIGAKWVYENGSCYRFYEILIAFATEAEPYYCDGHVITKIGNKFYDINGEISGERYVPYDPEKEACHTVKFNLWDCGLECENCGDFSPYHDLKSKYEQLSEKDILK